MAAMATDPIERAHTAGVRPRMAKATSNVVLTVHNRRRPVTLVKADGIVTAEGRRYYELEGISPPSVYAYEQPLIHGKWVRNFDGGKTMVRRFNAQGHWVVTAKGRDYFKFNRTKVVVEIPAVLARRRAKNKTKPFWLDRSTTKSFKIPVSMATVAPDGSTVRSEDDAALRETALRQARDWLATRPRFAETMDTGSADDDTADGSWVILDTVSEDYWLLDRTRELLVAVEELNVYDPSHHGADAVMEAPLQAIAVPDGCWRAYDLHPGTFESTGKCAVHMIHESFTRTKKKRCGSVQSRVVVHALTIEEIEAELDKIFVNLGYRAGEFPFERSWREDGCTPRMVLEFCKWHNLKCFIHHGKKMLRNYTPEGATNHTPTVHFTVFSGHAYWYGRPVDAPPPARADQNMANHAAAQMMQNNPEDDDTAVEERELASFVKRDYAPPFSEWRQMDELEFSAERNWEGLVTSAELNDRHERAGRQKAACLYFWTTDLKDAEQWVRKLHAERKNFDFRVLYGQHPDQKVAITMKLGSKIPKVIIKAVPSDHEELQEICKAACAEFNGADVLVYRGESRAQIGERLRLLFSKPRRTRLGDDLVRTLLERQGSKCAACSVALGGDDNVYEVDHETPLCNGGADDPSNLQVLCIGCHATKTKEERQCALYAPRLASRMNRDLLEGFLAAPKPRQICWGAAEIEGCVSIDAVRCRTFALTKNTVPLPVFHLTDCLHPGYEPGADFYYVSAGEVTTDNPIEALPYMGPGWYWCENFKAIMDSGRASQADVLVSIRAGEHVPADSLKAPLEAVESFVTKALVERCRLDFAPYTETIAQPYAKAMILAMQGLWTQQHHYSWQCVSSSMPEDAAGPVRITAPSELLSGVTTMMSRSERLSCITMFPVGVIALNKEHLHLYKLRLAMSPEWRFCGANVDCLYVKVRGSRKADLETELVDMVEKDHAPRIKRALGGTAGLVHADGSPIFRVERKDNGGDLKRQCVKPLPWTPRCHDLPIASPWAPPPPEDDDESLACFPEPFGHWLQNPPCRREWRKLTEPRGVGRGPRDTFQKKLVPIIVRNRGAFVVGRGGTGKSHLIASLVKAFEEEDFAVHVVALTHTAVANVRTDELQASTLLHFLHSSLRKKRKIAIIVDEMGMIPLSMQVALLEMHFMGHTIVQMGDPHGQFLPIPDRKLHRDIERIDTSDLMHDMCNGLHITLRKFRRGDDMVHFDFVGSLYDQCLRQALSRATVQYPATDGPLLDGVALTVSHRRRVEINEICNVAVKPLAHSRFVAVEEEPTNGVNRPQSIWLHRGLIVQACLQKTETNLRNGLRYCLLDFQVDENSDRARYQFEPTDQFGHLPLIHYGTPIEPRDVEAAFWLSEEEVVKKLRLTYAVTYFSAQAATIRQPLRLEDTEHPRYTIRHLIVGLGRAPVGHRVQVAAPRR